MKRTKLNARFVETVALSGKYHDEHGLILRVTPGEANSLYGGEPSGARFETWAWEGTLTRPSPKPGTRPSSTGSSLVRVATLARFAPAEPSLPSPKPLKR